LECADERLLNHIFRHLQTLDSKDAGEHRDQFAGFVAEEMFRQPVDLAGWR
jgi:hypothetical protein